jgi:hypothetical protein
MKGWREVFDITEACRHLELAWLVSVRDKQRSSFARSLNMLEMRRR